MLDTLLSIIAPHHCFGCGKNGTNLCQKCKNYIINQPYSVCIVCHEPSAPHNLCSRHQTPYSRAWCVAERSGSVQSLIDALKFERNISAHRALAELFDERLPILPDNTHIVPIPTAPRNVRRRGYDHMLLIARQLAKRRNLQVTPLLTRRNNITQHFAPNVYIRHQQAKTFFEISRKLTTDTTAKYLIIDDIFTSGATLKAAAMCLRKAGARSVDIAVIARQQ